MKNFLLKYLIVSAFLFVIQSCSYSFYADPDSVYLILDEPYTDSLPRNFRMSTGELWREHKEMPDTSGLSALNISGSSEFSDKSLPWLLKALKTNKVTVFDLRQETHGFINGMPVSLYGKYDWANLGLTRDEVINGEPKKLDSLKALGSINIIRIQKKDKATNAILKFENIPTDVKSAITEQEVTKSNGLGYFRLTVPDHRRPVDADVDRFLEYINSVPTDTHLHFHCHAGDGRTTTFMVMYDIMRNAKLVSLEDIIARQHLLGGIDLSKDEDFPDFDKQYAIERTEFLKKFYEYSKSNSDGFKTSYTRWLKK